jgi:hypothetical protein
MNILSATPLRSTIKKICVMSFVVLFASCGGEDDELKKEETAGESEVTLDGGGHYTKLTAEAEEVGTAVYNAGDDVTAVTYTAQLNGDDFLVIISFPGNQPGQFAWNIDDYSYAQVTHDMKGTTRTITAAHFYIEDNEYHEHTGHIKIDSYGNAGGIISGSFEGECSFLDSECNCYTRGTMKGSFKARRLN